MEALVLSKAGTSVTDCGSVLMDLGIGSKEIKSGVLSCQRRLSHSLHQRGSSGRRFSAAYPS